MKNWLLVSALLLSGCMVGPNYCKRQEVICDQWVQPGASTEPPVTDWWNLFADPLLTKYIETAAVYNNNILMAEANILQARAARQVSASKLFPQINLDPNGNRTYFSKNGPVFAIGNSTGTTTGSVSANTGLPFILQIPQVQNLYNVLFDASWEVDLFGKTRRSVEAAEANIGSSIEERNDLLLSLFAEVARNYMELRSNQKKEELLRAEIEILEKSREITSKRYSFGFVSKIPLEQIEVTLSTVRSQLPPVIAEIYKAIYSLSVLVGTLPECLVEELLGAEPLPLRPPAVALGLRSDLLKRRPDVRTMERKLAAATANIGVAVGSFFPVVTLVGDYGVQSLALSNLFSLKSKTWAFGADFNTPVFQGGNLIGNLKISQAKQAYAIHQYQQTILSALQEAESALVAYMEDIKVVEQKANIVKSDQELTYLSCERNQKGLVNLLDLLDNQRVLNEAEQDLLQSETQALLDLVALYKALGGGY